MKKLNDATYAALAQVARDTGNPLTAILNAAASCADANSLVPCARGEDFKAHGDASDTATQTAMAHGITLVANALAEAFNLDGPNRRTFLDACGVRPEARKCVNVPGGWQSADRWEGLFGPVFADVVDLWDWQRLNAGRTN